MLPGTGNTVQYALLQEFALVQHFVPADTFGILT